MTAQRAHVRVDGPVFVLVVTCSWQWKQVKVTGPSESSVGTTNWVATGGGALYSGPTSVTKKVKIINSGILNTYVHISTMLHKLEFYTVYYQNWTKVQWVVKLHFIHCPKSPIYRYLGSPVLIAIGIQIEIWAYRKNGNYTGLATPARISFMTQDFSPLIKLVLAGVARPV